MIAVTEFSLLYNEWVYFFQWRRTDRGIEFTLPDWGMWFLAEPPRFPYYGPLEPGEQGA